MVHMRHTEWSDTRISLLRKLWDEGLTGSEIGDTLGLSRSAVIAKVRRLGLERRAPGGPKDPAVNRLPRTRKKKGRPKVLRFIVDEAPRPRPKLNPAARMVRLADLEAHHCRWPEGDPRDPDFSFCGADRHEGEVYCPLHMRTAFQK